MRPRGKALLRVLGRTIERMIGAGFELGFSPDYWAYASGMPKGNGAVQAAMRTLGDDGVVTGHKLVNKAIGGSIAGKAHRVEMARIAISHPTDPRAAALTGAKLGWQLKPAVEVVIVAMKPLAERSYVAQALDNKHGVTWIDDARIPGDRQLRYPANLAVSDDVLGEFSRYFSIDAWWEELPADVRERLPFLVTGKVQRNTLAPCRARHPTQKPVELMAWLVTMGLRPGEIVVDQFCGSGSTGVAAGGLGRRFVGFEQNRQWVDVARRRLASEALP